MKLGKESKQEYYTYETDFTPEEAKVFVNYALKNIVNDHDALINWAVVDILKKQIEGKEEYNKFLQTINKKREGDKKDDKSNS